MSSTYTGPNSPYGEPRDNGWTWFPGAGSLYSQQNGFNPTTGAPVGPGSLPPHTIALEWQAEHERRVWQYRQNLMRSAHGYASGALGLLQSFRQGGSATLEAGQYNTLANIQLQRAGMTQPLDLTGDYVREQDSRARMRANRQAERQLAVQGAAALASVAGAFFTGGATLAALPGIVNAMSQSQYSSDSLQQTRQSVYGNSDAYAPPSGQGAPHGGQQGGGGAYGPPAPAAGGGGQAAGPMGPPAPSQGPQGGGSAMQSTLQPEQGGGAQPGGPGGQRGAGGQEGAGGGGFGGAGGGVGSDGNFTPVAFAARAAAMGAADPLQHLAITSMVADELENDPMFTRFAIGVDQRLAERLVAA